MVGPFPKKPPTLNEQRQMQNKSAKSSFLVMSKEGYQTNSGNSTGRNVYWTTDVLTQLPIHMESGEGPASLEPLTVPQLFQRNVKNEAKRDAMLVERDGVWVKWTWQDYYQDVRKFGKALLSLEVTERTSVNIIGFNAPEWFISFMGAIFANSIPSGVYATNTPEACLYIAKHSDAEVIVAENKQQLRKYETLLSEYTNIKAFVLYQDELPEHRKEDPRFFTWQGFLKRGEKYKEDQGETLQDRMDKQKPGMCCDIVYTSGTTGNPKGVMLSHDNFLWTLISSSSVFSQELDLTNERIVSYLPLSHVAAQISDLVNNITNKACIYFARPDALQGSLVETLKKVRPTQFTAVPRVWEKFEERIKAVAAKNGRIATSIGTWAKKIGFQATMNQLKGKPTPFCYSFANWLVFKRIKAALGLDRSMMNFYGAAPLKKTTRDYFASLNMPLLNMYGMSESAGFETGSGPFPFWNKLEAAGVPTPGTHIKIDKADPKDKEGEICYKGRNIFMGYLKNQEETRKAIDSQGFLHSGDLGYIDEDGFLHITGRMKELIITAGGQNVAPVPIEDKLKQLCPVLSNVILIGDNRKFVSALLTLKIEIDLMTGETKGKITDDANIMMRRVGFLREGESLDNASEVARDPKLLKFIEEKVKELNENHVVSRVSQIKKWKIIPGDFSLKGGQLTPTMKIKRKVVAAMYKKEIEEMYQEPKL